MHAPELAGAESAEDFFDRLGVPFDPAVLAASRLHVLRAFGLALAELGARRPAPGGAERLRLQADALRRAHDLYARAAALGEDAGITGAPRGCCTCGRGSRAGAR